MTVFYKSHYQGFWFIFLRAIFHDFSLFPSSFCPGITHVILWSNWVVRAALSACRKTKSKVGVFLCTFCFCTVGHVALQRLSFGAITINLIYEGHFGVMIFSIKRKKLVYQIKPRLLCSAAIRGPPIWKSKLNAF